MADRLHGVAVLVGLDVEARLVGASQEARVPGDAMASGALALGVRVSTVPVAELALDRRWGRAARTHTYVAKVQPPRETTKMTHPWIARGTRASEFFSFRDVFSRRGKVQRIMIHRLLMILRGSKDS